MPNLHDSGDDGLDALLGAARQGATPDELRHMDAVLDQFTAVVVGGVRAADVDTPDPVPSPRSSRTVFNTRIPRRAAAIVVATFFVAGTAAAAAGGVLPTPFSAADDPVLVDATGVDDTSVTDSSLDGVTDDTGVDGTDGVDDDGIDETDGSTPEDHSQSGRDFGNCQAWLNGADKDPANPAFSHLADEAAEAGVTIDEYCATLVDDHDAEHPGDDADDEADDDADDDGDDRGGSSPSLPDQSHGDDHPTGSSVPGGHGSDSGSSGRGGSGSGGRGGGDDSSVDD